MLRLRDIMTTDLVTISPEQTLREIMELLATRHVSGAPVMTNDTVLGVVSTTDLMTFAAAARSVPESAEERPTLGGVDPDEEWNEDDNIPAEFFTSLWAHRENEVAEQIDESEGPTWNVLDEHTVAEVMTRALCALPPETSVEEAAEVMRTAGIHRILVMDDGKLLGLVSTKDISDAVAAHKLTTQTYLFGSRAERQYRE